MKQKLHETSVDILWVTSVLPEKLPSDRSFSQSAKGMERTVAKNDSFAEPYSIISLDWPAQ